MHILITAGGTSEPIDRVRSITNHSTGRLGQQIAHAFLTQHHHVTYVTTAQALHPDDHPKLTLITIDTTDELNITLQQLFQTTNYDAIIHSMAVSDFTTEISLTQESFIQKLTTILSVQKTINQTTIKESLDTISQQVQQEKQEKKISSDTSRLLLFLQKNPKIIAKIRRQQPHALFIGFKLLVDVSRQQLIEVALNTLKQNQCDFILANDLTSIKREQHYGLLLNAQGVIGEGETKEEISQLIVQKVEEKWRDK